MESVLLEMRGSVALVTICRPEALNALNTALLKDIKDVFARLATDEAVRAVVLTGDGKAFVAGADIAEMQTLTQHQAVQFAARGAEVFAHIENLPQPVIAAVNGYALGGGCELALACDIRLASEKARFGQPEVGLGIIPGFGGTQRLTRAIGMSQAMGMILTGEPVTAAEAHRMGLVSAVHPPEALLDKAIALAEKIAANAPIAVRLAKQAVHVSGCYQLDKSIREEHKLFAQCFGTEDQRDAMTAFVEKRKLDGFKGK